MDAFALVCDFAEVVNGKLYIMGGGWTEIYKATPLTFALAAKLDVPWDRTNEQLLVEARLVDSDGHMVRHDDKDLVVQAQFELGRPAGVKKGSPIPVPLTWKFTSLDLPFGSMHWRIYVENEEVASASFNVRDPRQLMGYQPPA